MTEAVNLRGEQVEIRNASLGGIDFAERVIEVIAVPYDQEAVVDYRGETVRESFAPNAFDGIDTRNDHVTANREHDYSRTFGKVVEWRSGDPRGLIARIKVSDTALGDETLRLAADGVLKPSVGFVARPRDSILRNGLRRVVRAFMDHLSLVPNPAYMGADVLAVRQGQQQKEQGQPAPTPKLNAVLNDPFYSSLLEGQR